MKKDNKTSFRGSQQDLYEVCKLAWSLYKDHLSSFTQFNAKYNAQYGTDALAAVEAAAALPNVQKRRSGVKSINRKLQHAGKKCTRNWKKLNRYISNSFAADQLEAMRDAAGVSFYTAATKNNWNAVTNLNSMGAAFITEYAATLQNEGKGMPADFQAAFDASGTAFTGLMNDYTVTKAGSKKSTGTRTIANNAVYATLMSMISDAKTIFEDDAATLKLFSYAALLRLAGKGATSGFHITIKDSDTLLPVTTSTLLLQPGNITAYVNEKGVADVKINKGPVSYIITTPGYPVAYGDNIQLVPGVMHRIEIMLKKEVAAA